MTIGSNLKRGMSASKVWSVRQRATGMGCKGSKRGTPEVVQEHSLLPDAVGAPRQETGTVTDGHKKGRASG